jgi:hypothetical protein
VASDGQNFRKCTHVFYSASVVTPVSPSVENGSSISALRVATKRRPSESSIHSGSISRSFPFSFDLPSGSRPGEELPSTFSSTAVSETSPRARAFVETAQVKYALRVNWETTDGSENRATYVNFMTLLIVGSSVSILSVWRPPFCSSQIRTSTR